MNIILNLHGTFGMMVLPLLIVVVAIWLTITWRPDTPPSRTARFFPVLVDIQATLGLIVFIYGITVGAPYLAFPFILHPILGLLAAGLAHMAVRPGVFTHRLGRWGPLGSLALLLLIVLANIALAEAG